MNIVVAVRCLNEINNIPRFMRGYDFADTIVVSDGGSTDGSVELIKERQKLNSKIRLLSFGHHVIMNGHYFNEDAPHMNFVLDAAKAFNPDWLIFDDLDCNPNVWLRDGARLLFDVVDSRHVQMNAYRLYLWGDDQYFPKMSGYQEDTAYCSLWAWKPSEIDIHADPNIKHGTMVGLSKTPYNIEPPMCLLHKSWHPDTIQAKIDRYNAIGLPFNHPFEHAGELANLPEWATE